MSSRSAAQEKEMRLRQSLSDARGGKRQSIMLGGMGHLLAESSSDPTLDPGDIFGTPPAVDADGDLMV
jgi:2-keto-4-pentenoate hydratase/2-oxohepta-3-ene-1,7-dioic acid hydratase in catechol pathway